MDPQSSEKAPKAEGSEAKPSPDTTPAVPNSHDLPPQAEKTGSEEPKAEQPADPEPVVADCQDLPQPEKKDPEKPKAEQSANPEAVPEAANTEDPHKSQTNHSNQINSESSKQGDVAGDPEVKAPTEHHKEPEVCDIPRPEATPENQAQPEPPKEPEEVATAESKDPEGDAAGDAEGKAQPEPHKEPAVLVHDIAGQQVTPNKDQAQHVHSKEPEEPETKAGSEPPKAPEEVAAPGSTPESNTDKSEPPTASA